MPCTKLVSITNKSSCSFSSLHFVTVVVIVGVNKSCFICRLKRNRMCPEKSHRSSEMTRRIQALFLRFKFRLLLRVYISCSNAMHRMHGSCTQRQAFAYTHMQTFICRSFRYNWIESHIQVLSLSLRFSFYFCIWPIGSNCKRSPFRLSFQFTMCARRRISLFLSVFRAHSQLTLAALIVIWCGSGYFKASCTRPFIFHFFLHQSLLQPNVFNYMRWWSTHRFEIGRLFLHRYDGSLECWRWSTNIQHSPEVCECK